MGAPEIKGKQIISGAQTAFGGVGVFNGNGTAGLGESALDDVSHVDGDRAVPVCPGRSQ